MEPKSNKLLAVDISNYLWYLNIWSSSGFQRFLESGIISHMAEAVKAGTGRITPDLEKRTGRQSWISGNIGGVSSGQLQKLLSLIPGDVTEKREFWEGFRIWSCYSALWDDHVPGWYELDDWCEDMGLERINPVRLIGPHGRLLIFRRMGYGRPMEAPSGYRYATREELKKVVAPTELYIAFNFRGKWWRGSPDFSEEIIDPGRYFHSLVVYVPIVELEVI